jgi:hypothetical protein
MSKMPAITPVVAYCPICFSATPPTTVAAAPIKNPRAWMLAKAEENTWKATIIRTFVFWTFTTCASWAACHARL